jgi:type I restriction enzyme S subunit
VKRFPAYPSYKPAGIFFLEKIPDHWTVQKLKFNSYLKGRIGWQNLRSEDFTDEGPFLITGMHFSEGKVDWDSCFHVSEDRYDIDPYIQVKENDLLITKDGSIGKLAYIDNLPYKATLNSHLLVIRPKDNQFINRFMYYLLSSLAFFNHIQLFQNGTTFFGITQESISEFTSIFPPLPEQKSIVTFLDAKTAQIDSLITKYNRLINLLIEKRSALITAAVTGKISSLFKAKLSNKNSNVGWIEEIPNHWLIKKLKYLSWIETGNTPPKNDIENYDEGTILWVKPNDLNQYVSINETKEKLTKKGVGLARLIPSGSGLVCCIGSVGKVGMSDYICATNQQINAVIFTKPNLWHPRYGLYSLIASSEEHQRLSNSVVVAILNKTGQSVIMFPVPPLSEQLVIFSFLDREVSTIDSVISKIRTLIDKFQEYRSSLINAAITGQIDVRSFTGRASLPAI